MNAACRTEEVERLKGYIDKLNAAIANGARSVTLGGQTIIYNTTESLIKARNDMRAQLAAEERVCLGASRASRQHYAVFAGRDY